MRPRATQSVIEAPGPSGHSNFNVETSEQEISVQLQGMYFRFQCDNCVYKTYQMRIVPAFLLPQPHHHLGNMYQYSNQVIYTKLQHCDTLSAVFAHVASRLATTDYHRSTQTARATVNMSDN